MGRRTLWFVLAAASWACGGGNEPLREPPRGGCTPVCDKDDEGAMGESAAQVATGSPFVAGDGDPTLTDFHLSGGTQPGLTLAAPFDVDPDGVARGADGNWDRGAYELP